MEKILLIEDAAPLRDALSVFLTHEGFEVDAVEDAETALPLLTQSNYACIISDFRLPGMDGIEFLKRSREVTKAGPFLLMTAYGSIEIAVDAMKHGASDFIVKPFEPKNLSLSVRDLIKHNRVIERRKSGASRRNKPLFTSDPGMSRILTQATKASRVDSTVLLLGESGTGKELLARFIHEQSSRKDKPFVAVNCGAIPKELMESEFFGHEAGAFTGATRGRIGIFEYASEGTVFLDEVGELSPNLQVKLLRALQDGEIKRVGGNETLRVNPRIIAATNQDLHEAIKEGDFREDFYYRLAIVTLTLPPLRARRADIELLAKRFISNFATLQGKESAPELDPTALDILKHYDWPGNARELENVMERAVLLSGNVIRPENLGIDLKLSLIEEGTATLHEIAARAAKEAEFHCIELALRETGGNKTKAAEKLGVSYKTLLQKVKEYNL